jgi:hypothetical protein
VHVISKNFESLLSVALTQFAMRLHSNVSPSVLVSKDLRKN